MKCEGHAPCQVQRHAQKFRPPRGSPPPTALAAWPLSQSPKAAPTASKLHVHGREGAQPHRHANVQQVARITARCVLRMQLRTVQ